MVQYFICPVCEEAIEAEVSIKRDTVVVEVLDACDCVSERAITNVIRRTVERSV